MLQVQAIILRGRSSLSLLVYSSSSLPTTRFFFPILFPSSFPPFSLSPTSLHFHLLSFTTGKTRSSSWRQALGSSCLVSKRVGLSKYKWEKEFRCIKWIKAVKIRKFSHGKSHKVKTKGSVYPNLPPQEGWDTSSWCSFFQTDCYTRRMRHQFSVFPLPYRPPYGKVETPVSGVPSPRPATV